MKYKYNLFFVPHIEDKKKLSHIRRKICYKLKSKKALEYPLHMSLISGGFYVKNHSEFEKELKKICKNQSNIKINCSENIDVMPKIMWTGINIKKNEEIKNLRVTLQKLRNKFATEKQIHLFKPLHITFAYPANVKGLNKIKNPVEKMIFDRITIARKESEKGIYRIFKHIKFN